MSSITLTGKNILPAWTNELFDSGRFFKPLFSELEKDWNFASQLPSVNLVENGKEFRIEMAAPGYDKGDFKVKVLNNVLSISAEKKVEKKEEKDNYTRREFSYNNFERSFTLPENCLPEKAEAKYDKGILLLTLPKKEVLAEKPSKEIRVG